MECSVCDLRGAVQACSYCHAQICEVCGVNCRRCGKPVCPNHVYKTHSGKMLCPDCQEERKAKRAHLKAMADRADAEEFGDAPRIEKQDSGLSEDEALTGSVRKPTPPWKLSLYAGIVGLVAVLVVFVIPGLREVPIPGGIMLPTPYFLMVIPVAALIWGLVGLLNEEYKEDTARCVAGLVLSVAGILLMVVAVATDPARKAAQDAADAQMVRIKMNPQQLNDWRNEKLQRYRRSNLRGWKHHGHFERLLKGGRRPKQLAEFEFLLISAAGFLLFCLKKDDIVSCVRHPRARDLTVVFYRRKSGLNVPIPAK